MTRKWLKSSRLLRGGNGIGLLETMVALGVLGFIGAAFMTALGVSFRSTEISEKQVTAENIVRTQLEYIRDQGYCIPPTTPYIIPQDGGCGTYDVPPPGVTPPADYTITLEIAEYCDDTGCYPIEEIQMLTARAFRDGKLVSKVSDLKTNR